MLDRKEAETARAAGGGFSPAESPLGVIDGPRGPGHNDTEVAMRHCIFRLVVVLIAVSIAALPVAARQNISNSSTPSWGPRIAVGPGNVIHVAWMESYSDNSGDCYYALSAGGATWTTPINLSQSKSVRDSGHRAVNLDVDDSGRVYVIWTEGSALRMRTSSGGEWDGGMTIAENGRGIEGPAIACDGAGNLYVAWESGDGYVCSRARVDGYWEPVRWISRSGVTSKNAAIAVGSSQVFASWSDKGGGEYKYRFSQRNKSANSTWATSSAIPGTSTEHEDQYSAVEADSDDRGHFVWAYYLGGNRRLVGAHGQMGRFSGIENISSDELLHYPSVCEVNNVVVVAWQVGGWGNGQCIKYNAYNGGWGGAGSVPESGGATYIDVDATSDAKTAWFAWDGGGDIWVGSAPVQGGGGGDNKRPVASFTYTPHQGDAPLTVAFDASASYDPDGKIASYAWDFGDGGSGSSEVVNHTYLAQGDYTAGLTVTDDDGAWSTKFVTVKVLDSNKPPVARFSYSPHSGEYPLEVTFDASASSDPDGSVASYSWDFGDNSSGKGRVVKHTFTSAREFEVQLTVEDNKGKKDTQIHPVDVEKPNKPPVARFTFTPKQGEFPVKISYDASSSSDSDGSVKTYSWDFGDGKFGTGRTASHTYTWAGTFTIKLKITDDRGKTAEKTDSLTVIKPNDPPRADFVFSPSGGFYPIDIGFDGTASVDPDGTIVSYAWEFGDGGTSTAAKPLHRFASWGTYTVKLTVVDDRKGTARCSKSIVVLRLFQPLNIRWTTTVDEGLFTRRYVTDLAWDPNLDNDRIARIVGYRIFRKAAGAALTAYAPLALVDAATRAYRDSDAGGQGMYEYTVTAVDDRGHESPITR